VKSVSRPGIFRRNDRRRRASANATDDGGGREHRQKHDGEGWSSVTLH
jgi:hypothetical protein